MAKEKLLLTADEAAAIMSISKRTVLKWARDKKIESVKISPKVVRFTPEAVEEFLKSNTSGVEYQTPSSKQAGRKTASPQPRKGGDRRLSGELWSDLRKEVRQWQ